MNIIKQLIEQYKLTGTPQEIADALNAKTIPVSTNQRVTWPVIAATLGVGETTEFDNKLKALGLEWVRMTLSGEGFDFTHPKTQEMLDQFHADGHLDADELLVLKSLGYSMQSPYEQVAGIGNVVTPEQVENALQPVTVIGHDWSVIVRGDGQGIHCVYVINEKYSDGTVKPISTVLSNNAVNDEKVPTELMQAVGPIIQYAAQCIAALS